MMIKNSNGMTTPSTDARSVRFTSTPESQTSSGAHYHQYIPDDSLASTCVVEHTLSEFTSPRSIPSTPFIIDGQLELSPDTIYMTENDSFGVSPTQLYEYSQDDHSHTTAWEHHQSPIHDSTASYVHPSSPPPARSSPRIVAPRLSKSMKATQKKAWDVRFPPEATPYDNNPALQDASAVSVNIACNLFPEDIVLSQNVNEEEDLITVADIYIALYETLRGEVTATHPLFAQRTASEKADIQDATARRLEDPSVKSREWKGQLRDLLGKYCVLKKIVADDKLGKWRLEFGKADD